MRDRRKEAQRRFRRFHGHSKRYKVLGVLHCYDEVYHCHYQPIDPNGAGRRAQTLLQDLDVLPSQLLSPVIVFAEGRTQCHQVQPCQWENEHQ